MVSAIMDRLLGRFCAIRLLVGANDPAEKPWAPRPITAYLFDLRHHLVEISQASF
jgi:hypothetical protein